MDYDFSILDKKITDTKDWLVQEYQSLRTGRANPGLLDAIQINAYGTSTPLKQIGSIMVEDARTIRIVPWDATLIKEVEGAITEADLGVGVGSDSTGVRISFPELTSERREEFVKMAKGKLEDARTAIRKARDDTWNDIQKKEREGDISEDEKYSLKEDMEKKVSDGNDSMEGLYFTKEAEILNK